VTNTKVQSLTSQASGSQSAIADSHESETRGRQLQLVAGRAEGTICPKPRLVSQVGSTCRTSPKPSFS
jgi:hypothetical protein